MKKSIVIREVNRLLKSKGIEAAFKGDKIQFNVCNGLIEWQSIINLHKYKIALFARYPQKESESIITEQMVEKKAVLCNKINQTLGNGCMLTDDRGFVLYKQIITFTSEMDVSQQVFSALEEQTFVMMKYWNLFVE